MISLRRSDCGIKTLNVSYHQDFSRIFCGCDHQVSVFGRICNRFLHKDIDSCIKGIEYDLFVQFCGHDYTYRIKPFSKHFLIICICLCLELCSHSFDALLVYIRDPGKFHALHFTVNPYVVLSHCTCAYYSYSDQKYHFLFLKLQWLEKCSIRLHLKFSGCFDYFLHVGSG